MSDHVQTRTRRLILTTRLPAAFLILIVIMVIVFVGLGCCPSDTHTHRKMTTKKLHRRELAEFDELDVDDLLTQLSAEELKILSKEVDPDVNIHSTFSSN